MSIALTKQSLADAITGVAGLTGYATKPKVLKSGDAYVRWGGWRRADGAAYEATYTVTIVLPQGSEEAADTFAYDHADAIEQALRPLMFVDEILPSSIPAEGSSGGLYALTVTGRTE